MSRVFLRACFVVAVAVVGPSGAGSVAGVTLAAQARGQADEEAARLFREVMSPFCPGLTLADCPSPAAFTLRNEISARLAKGEPRQAVVDELVAKYGTQILSDPSDTPIGTVVWGVPFALAGLAALGVAFVVRRATRADAVEPAVAAAGNASLHARLDDELDRID